VVNFQRHPPKIFPYSHNANGYSIEVEHIEFKEDYWKSQNRLNSQWIPAPK